MKAYDLEYKSRLRNADTFPLFATIIGNEHVIKEDEEEGRETLPVQQYQLVA